MTLTHRENQILELLTQGYNQREIAVKVGLSYHTVCEHMLTARRKFGVKHTIALLAAFHGKHHTINAPSESIGYDY